MFTYCMEQRTDISHRNVPTVRQAKGNPQLVTIARAAQQVERTGETRYVFATYAKWNLATESPQSGSYYELAADGRWLVER